LSAESSLTPINYDSSLSKQTFDFRFNRAQLKLELVRVISKAVVQAHNPFHEWLELRDWSLGKPSLKQRKGKF
jgi:hypothetical protein